MPMFIGKTLICLHLYKTTFNIVMIALYNVSAEKDANIVVINDSMSKWKFR
jgi:hypothetical protein